MYLATGATQWEYPAAAPAPPAAPYAAPPPQAQYAPQPQPAAGYPAPPQQGQPQQGGAGGLMGKFQSLDPKAQAALAVFRPIRNEFPVGRPIGLPVLTLSFGDL